jgi:flagellar biosynthetic protein FlhB
MVLLFSLSKIVLAVLAGLLVVLHYQNQLLSLNEQSMLPKHISNVVSIGSQTVFASLAVLFVLGICDFGWQRYAWKADLLMTRREIIEEHREHSGRANEARMHSTWVDRRRPEEIVPSLIVVGLKMAVSLRWNASTMTAPIVLDIFKGDHLMSKLEQLRKEGIAMVENNVLAQEISQGSDAGFGIPSILHGEIASVLINLKRNIR